jgi:hypothetical protein
MSNPASRSETHTVGPLEALYYDDGDLTLQERSGSTSGAHSTGFVLAPKQISKFQTRARLVVSASDPISYRVGENCVGDRLFVRFTGPDSPADERYAIADSTDQVLLSESHLVQLLGVLKKLS